jgi:hypothetical protein
LSGAGSAIRLIRPTLKCRTVEIRVRNSEWQVVLVLVDAVFRIHFDYEHRFAEHEHDFATPFQNHPRFFRAIGPLFAYFSEKGERD